MIESEFLDIAGPVLADSKVQSLSRNFHHPGKSRLEHVKEVAWLSFLWGKRLSLDCTAIVRGAFLHDLFFTPWRGQGPRLHGCRHHNTALRNARQITDLSAKEVDIIKKHMWPLTLAPPRYRESFVVCLVDKYCATKDYLMIWKWTRNR